MPLNYSFTYSLLFQGKLESQGKFTDFSKKELQSLNILNEDKVENKKSSAAAEVVEMMNGKNIDQSNLLKTLTTNKVEETRETQELIAKGKMKSSIFFRYFCSGNSHFLLVSTFLCFFIAQAIRCGSDYWLSFW